MKDYEKILLSIQGDTTQFEFWNKYVSKNNFAKGIKFEQVLNSIHLLFIKISKENISNV